MSPRFAVCLGLMIVCGLIGACRDSDPPVDVGPALENSTTDPHEIVEDSAPASPLPLESHPELIQRSSWENPFREDFWHGSGWTFSESTITAGLAPASATLLRPWSRFMLEFGLDATDVESPESNSPVSEDSVLLLIQLAHPNGAESLQVSAGRNLIELQRGRSDQWQTIRSVAHDAAVEAGRLRLNLTGNRILVAWNDRLLINSDRPSTLHASVYLTLATTGHPVGVSRMRIEGE